MSIYWNGSELNSLMLNGVQTTGIFNGEVVWGNSVHSFKTLTLYHSEGGTLTANKLTGYPGETINLTTAYDTYWRFSGYQLTGDGSLVGNDYTFGTEDASICACYKVNAFTATGGWEKGSNVSVNAIRKTKEAAVGAKYAVRNASTGDIPASWYSTSNRWNPSNASAYSITLKPITKTDYSIMKRAAGGAAGYKVIIGSTDSNAQNFSVGGGVTGTWTYNKSITTTIQTTYYISGYVKANGHGAVYNEHNGTVTYVAANTTGTWTATGIAP